MKIDGSNLLQKLEDSDLFNIRLVNAFFNRILKDQNFWRDRISIKYPQIFEFKLEQETYEGFYLKISHYISKLEEKCDVSYSGYNLNKEYNKYVAALVFASQIGYNDMILSLFEKYDFTDKEIFYKGLANAFYYDNTDSIKLLLTKVKDHSSSYYQTSLRCFKKRQENDLKRKKNKNK